MAAVHPNCNDENCYGAFVATRRYGLYMTESLVFDTNSDPTWEHVGQIMQIKQFSFDHKTPVNAQVCVDFNDKGWLRRKSWGDSWYEVLNKAKIMTALAAAGYSTNSSWETQIGWIDFWPNDNLYAIVQHGNSSDAGADGGQYFLKSTDNGSSWYCPPTGRLYGSTFYNFGVGALGIQYGHNQIIAPGAVLYASVHKSWGDSAGMVYSMDFGESWGPWNPEKQSCEPNWFQFVSNVCRPMASRYYINSVYYGKPLGGRFRMYRVDGWGQSGYGTDKAPTYDNTWKTGWNVNVDSAVCHNDQQSVYTADFDTVYRTSNLEGPVNPVWNRYTLPSHVNDIEEYAQNVLFGFWGPAMDPSDNQWHTVYSTDNFTDFYYKAGSNPNRQYDEHFEIQTGSIHRDCDGAAVNGIALWDALDPIIEDPPPTGSGWPVWLNAEARELRPDPGWDRLYVVAETVWPAGEGLWNQPLLFQFILSGDLAGTYFENQGFLAFLPTLNALGQDTIYSGEMSYDGHIEMHVDSAIFHQATVVGKFDTGKQVYHNEDMTSTGFTYQSGWPIEGWQLAGAFGAERVSSVAHASVIENDMTISKDQITWPENISGYPWTWENLFASPFVVNTQLREAYNLFVGAEATAVAQPIRFINITLSGTGWENRGGGLPEIPINDIERGDY